MSAGTFSSVAYAGDSTSVDEVDVNYTAPTYANKSGESDLSTRALNADNAGYASSSGYSSTSGYSQTVGVAESIRGANCWGNYYGHLNTFTGRIECVYGGGKD